MKSLVMLLCCLFTLEAKSADVHEFDKYSYFCFAIDKSATLNGTCFFYKSNKDVYLVTNYHVFYGRDFRTNTLLLPVDTLRICYVSSVSKLQKVFKIVAKDLRKTNIQAFDAPDLMAKKLDSIPADFTINCINDLFDPHIFNRKPDSVFICGYPAIYNHVINKETVEVRKYSLSGMVTDLPPGRYTPPIISENEIHNFKKLKRRIISQEFIVSVAALPGFSGSPVYGRFIKNGIYKFRFIGVVFASNITQDVSIVINGKTFEGYIKSCISSSE